MSNLFLFCSQIPDFIVHCNQILNLMADSTNSAVVVLKFEEILPETVETSLATKANQQPRATSELLELHFQLLEVLLIFSSLDISTKYSINALFNEVSRDLLACDISMELNAPLSRADDTVNKARKYFLHRTINAAVDLIRKDFQEVFLTDFNLWIDKVMTLGKKWNLNLDDLLKYQIIQLYTREWDEYAETKIDQVLQPSSMGKTLISITATRLNQFVRNKPELYSRVLAIGARISAYLETVVRTLENYGDLFIF